MTLSSPTAVAIVSPVPNKAAFTEVAAGATFATALAAATTNRMWALTEAANGANVPANPERWWLVVDNTGSSEDAHVYFSQAGATANTPATTNSIIHRNVPAGAALELPYPYCTRFEVMVIMAGTTATACVVTEFSHGSL